MAKVLGLTNTTIRGKIGNTVFYTRKAQSLARMYQPVVSNPKTELQLRQRTKLNLAVALNRRIREEFKKIIGTGVGSYEYQGVQKIIMNSAIFKQMQCATNELDGNTRAAWLSGLNLKNVMDAVGKNYSNEGLNIFIPGETIACVSKNATGQVQAAQESWLIRQNNGIWSIGNPITEAQPETLYFGCDYELGNKIFKTGITYTGTGLIGQAGATIQTIEYDITPVSIDNVTFVGTRLRGMAGSVEYCGSGWKFYYSMAKPKTRGNIGVCFNVQGNIEGVFQNVMNYNLAFIVGTAKSSDNTSIQIMKGFSYNSYVAQTETPE